MYFHHLCLLTCDMRLDDDHFFAMSYDAKNNITVPLPDHFSAMSWDANGNMTVSPLLVSIILCDVKVSTMAPIPPMVMG